VSDERALLAAICAHPDEEVPRLAYADWLDEYAGSMPKRKGESARLRAELIRVQCALARLPPDEEDAATAIRRAELENRQDVLLSRPRHRQEWAQPLIAPEGSGAEIRPDEGTFVRGFPLHASGHIREVLATGARVFDISPLHQLVCQGYYADFSDELLAQPWLARVRRLVVVTNPFRRPVGSEFALTEQLFAAQALTGLESLGLNLWGFGAPGAPVARQALVNLRRLDLWGGPPRPASFVRLGELLPTTVRLREFSFTDYHYGPDDLTALAAQPQFSVLERLTLGGSVNEYRHTRPLDAATLRAVAAAPFWKSLRALVGERTRDSGLQLAAVAALPTTPANLRTLALTADYRAEGITALFDNPLLSTVTALDLAGTVLGTGTHSLASSPHLRRLLSLKLSSCPFSDFGVKALARAPFAANLVRLNLQRCEIGPGGFAALLAPRNFPNLRRLEIQGTRPTRAHLDRLRARYGDGVRV
jgi:uncharacterized protein (TIGR02996 family)